jgi:GMP synthase (glutamine-hydrolysing)
MLDRVDGANGTAIAALWRGSAGVRVRPGTRKPVLIVVHQRHSSPGHVGNWFRAHGFLLDIRRPALGDPLPETLEHHTGAIIFGGPQSANDLNDFIRIETEWISVPLREEKPFLGICLGAQMLARHLGGEVGFDPEAHAEIGYYPVRPTPEGEALMAWPERVYQWHREGFTLPSGATLLARGERFENQAFRYGPAAFGVQFHPEITHALVNRWSTHASHRLVLPGARPRPEHISGHVRHGPGQRRWLADLLSLWVSQGAENR